MMRARAQSQAAGHVASHVRRAAPRSCILPCRWHSISSDEGGDVRAPKTVKKHSQLCSPSPDFTRRQRAARAAWRTMRKPWWRAGESAKKSKTALEEWAEHNGWRVVFLDAKSGNPRTGIVDAVLVRIASQSPDTVELKLVQLKGGNSGLKPAEVRRLERATENVKIDALHVYHDREGLCFGEPYLPRSMRRPPV